MPFRTPSSGPRGVTCRADDRRRLPRRRLPPRRPRGRRRRLRRRARARAPTPGPRAGASRLLYTGVAIVCVGIGLGLPAAAPDRQRRRRRPHAVGGVDLTATQAKGRELFASNCATCHTLQASNSVGEIGPNLDVLRPAAGLVENAILVGRARGDGNMPVGLLTGDDAKDVADYVAAVAGRGHVQITAPGSAANDDHAGCARRAASRRARGDHAARRPPTPAAPASGGSRTGVGRAASAVFTANCAELPHRSKSAEREPARSGRTSTRSSPMPRRSPQQVAERRRRDAAVQGPARPTSRSPTSRRSSRRPPAPDRPPRRRHAAAAPASARGRQKPLSPRDAGRREAPADRGAGDPRLGANRRATGVARLFLREPVS